MSPLCLSGALTRAEVLDRLSWLTGCLREKGAVTGRSGSEPSSTPETPITIDLSGITRVDTSAVALMLAAERFARHAGLSLQWRAPPDSLQALLRLSSAQPLFQFA